MEKNELTRPNDMLPTRDSSLKKTWTENKGMRKGISGKW